MKITGKYHVTATERRHIKAIIANGWTEGASKMKSYNLTKTDYGYEVAIRTSCRDDYGRKKIERSTAYVEIAA